MSTGPSTSGARSLELLLDQDDPSFLVRKLGARVTKVVASVNMLVVDRGDGEVDFFSVTDGLGPTRRGIFFVHPVSTKVFSAEVSRRGSRSSSSFRSALRTPKAFRL